MGGFVADDQFNFETRLEFKSVDADKQMAELGRYVAALDKAIKEQTKFGKSSDTLAQRSKEAAREIERLSKEFLNGSSDVAAASEEYGRLVARLDKVASVYRVARQEAAKANSAIGEGSVLPENPRAWTDEQLRSYQDIRRADSTSLDSSVSQELQRRLDITNEFRQATQNAQAAQERLNAAMSYTPDERSDQQRLQDQIAAATQERDNAQRQLRSAEQALAQQDNAETQQRVADAANRKAAAQEELTILRQQSAEMRRVREADEERAHAQVEALQRTQNAEMEAGRQRLEAIQRARSEEEAANNERVSEAQGLAKQQIRAENEVADARARASQDDIDYRNRTSQMSALEKATYDYARALQEQAEAQSQLAKTDSNSAGYAGARDRLTSANEGVESARLEYQRQSLAVTEEQTAAQQKFNDTLSSLDYQKSLTGMSKMEVATKKLRDSQDQLDKSIEQVRKEEEALGEATTETYNKATQDLNKRIAAERELNQVLQAQEAQLLNTRYGLYDASRTAAVFAAAMVAAGTATAVAFAEVESGQSQMEQTNMDKTRAEIDAMHESVEELAGSLPIAVGELQGLFSLAGQLGVSGDLSTFVEDAAAFGTISDSLGAEEAATSVAKLVNAMGGAESVLRDMGLAVYDAAGNISNAEDAYRLLFTAVAELGVSSAATDQEIMHTAMNLARVGAQAGFSADEVVGFASATASIGVPAENARSAMQDFVHVMNTADASKMEDVAGVMGMTAQEVESMWASNPADFFVQFLAAVDAADASGQNMTETLARIGIEGKRGVPTLSALAKGWEGVAEMQGIAEEGAHSYEDEMNTFRQRLSLVTDDLASMWEILKSQVLLTMAELGKQLAPILKDSVQFLGELMINIREFLNTPFGEGVARFLTFFGSIATVIAGVSSVLLLAAGAGIALRVSVSTLPGFLQRMIGPLVGVGTAARGAATGMAGAATGARLLRGSLFALGRATIVIGLLQLAFEMLAWAIRDPEKALYDVMVAYSKFAPFLISGWADILGSIVSNSGRMAAGLSGAFATAVEVVGGAANSILRIWGRLAAAFGVSVPIPQIDFGRMADDIRAAGDAAQEQANRMVSMFDYVGDNWQSMMADWGNRLKKERFTRGDPLSGEDFFDWSDIESYYEDLMAQAEEAGADMGESIGNGIGDGAGKGADKAKKELRTLVDYASDLSGVFQRAFDLRFGSMLSRDSITSSWLDVADAFEEARKNVRDLQLGIRELKAEMQGTASSITQLEYFLSVAVDYGDTMRAAEIEAELAKLRAEQAKQAADLADKQKELRDAEEAASGTLEGNSRAAIENRGALTDLIGTYQDHLRVLAESGMSQEDLFKESQRLKKEFIAQAIQMGYSQKEVYKYAEAFDDMSKIIAVVPRNVTIEFDGDPALTALREFLAKAEQDIADFNASNPIGGGGGVPDLGGGFDRDGRPFKRWVDEYAGVVRDVKRLVDKGYKDGLKIGEKARKINLKRSKDSNEDVNEDTRKQFNDLGRRLGAIAKKVATEQERTFERSGRNSGWKFNQNVSTGIATILPMMKLLGTRSGVEFGTALAEAGSSTGARFASRVTSGISATKGGFATSGRTAGRAFQDAAVGAANSGITGRMYNVATNGGKSFQNQFARYGTWSGTRFRDRAVGAIKAGTDSAAYNAGWSAGNAFIKALQTNLNGKPIRFTGDFTRVGGNLKASHWTGGYTGRGGKFTPAGIVHKGEYVVPKQGVNQATGLPKPEYMNSLGQPHRGSRASYASGGYVAGGNSGIMVVELSAADRKAIANSKSPVNVVIGNETVARAANAANLTSANNGRN